MKDEINTKCAKYRSLKSQTIKQNKKKTLLNALSKSDARGDGKQGFLLHDLSKM